MIKINVNYDDNYVSKFKVSGHAGYDVSGQDIVCASVSSLVISSINLALRLNEKSVVVTQKEGLIDAKVLVHDKVINEVFLNMINMLEELQKSYKNNIKFIQNGGPTMLKLQIQLFAHVKAQGSTHNGRDSEGRRLGAKAADGELISAGSIIYRQRGTKIYPGVNVGMGKDHTLFAKITGYVRYERKGRDKKQVSVYETK